MTRRQECQLALVRQHIKHPKHPNKTLREVTVEPALVNRVYRTALAVLLLIAGLVLMLGVQGGRP